ncbi:DUF2029 domain-containing protein [Acidaminobacter sp. JC074]|uniref:ArnT family glycosyltransferase n=1 Tax=Acidaminobacter sp. JC074 TaxID=2530199 RepID=UPI001F100E0B|nr:4-amino-4-deoxy-L-arabinose transferase [Acidaminobacter sp. JC074]MCH4888442.1 DUF2029 domain-containing protein [Acidaminobacter sp. JC074]
MKNNIKKYIRKYDIYIFLTIFFIINLVFLTKFPFIHSDESWLSGFSRQVMEVGFKTSETFFIEYPRAVHGLRSVFTGLQIIFINLFGYSVFSVRLLSLTASTVSLYFLHKILDKRGIREFENILMLVIVACHIQFVYVSHIARQESIIMMVMVITYYLNIEKAKPILTGCLIGLAVGVHPNSLLIALGIGLVYLYKIYIRETRFRDLVKLIVTTGLFALMFVIFSFLLNPNFIADYMAFGESLGVVNFEYSRLSGFYLYYVKLFKEIGGTYQLYNIKPDIILMVISLLPGIYAVLKKKDFASSFLMVLAINIGLMIIGRYNQTAVIFVLLFNGLFYLQLIHSFKYKYVLLAFVLILTVNNSWSDIKIKNDDYGLLKDHLQLEGKVLGNLNLDYHLDNGQLIDYRNLWYIEDFEAYIEKHDIDYIILPEEMSYIKKTSPKWDILYGPLPYYDSMVKYLETCKLVDSFESKTYGMRIARYVNTYPWKIDIYKVPSQN